MISMIRLSGSMLLYSGVVLTCMATPLESDETSMLDGCDLLHVMDFPTNERILLDWHIKSSKMGNTDSMIKLGLAYEKRGTNIAEAVRLYCLASAKGNTEGTYNLGKCCLNGTGITKNESEAFRLLSNAANKGSVEAMNMTGKCYEWGHGCKKDYSLAEKWYSKSAESGYVKAMNNLGFYLYCCGKTEDAVKWYLKSAETGDTEAMRQLENAYEEWKGLEKNPTEAIRWCRKGAEAGDIVLMNRMGERYAKGIGIGINTNESFNWYNKSFQRYEDKAQKGNLVAMFKLGECYANGLGVVQNFPRAVHWYQKAADGGNEDSMYNLARCFANGEGVIKSDVEAFNWYKKAADMGHGKSLYALGQCYGKGIGTDINGKKAFEAYRDSAKKFNTEGMFAIATVYRIQEYFEDAFYWYRLAFDLGNMKAASSLHDLYNSGRGVEKNIAEAELCLMEGVRAEDPESMFWYGLSRKKENGEIGLPKVEWLLKAANAGHVDAMICLAIAYDNGNGTQKDKEKAFFLVFAGCGKGVRGEEQHVQCCNANSR